MGSAIGPAFAYLMANLPGVLQAVDPTVGVVDGWADELPRDFFVVGRASDSDQEASTSVDAYTLLGGELLDEEFILPCYIDCWRGGNDQSLARNAALAYLDAFIKFLAGDLTLGGALHNGRYARMDAIRIDGPVPGDAVAGRRCVIQFSIRCQNQYDPSV